MLPVKTANPNLKITEQFGGPTSLGAKFLVYSKQMTRLTVQPSPFNVPSTLSVDIKQILKYQVEPFDYPRFSDGWSVSSGLWRHAYNKAYARLQDDINSSTSQLGANLGELNKSVATVNGRLLALFKFTVTTERKMREQLLLMKKRKHGRKTYRRFVKIGKLNGVPPSVAKLFIEYRWVYESTAKDVYNSVQFCSNFKPKTKVSGAAKVKDVRYSARTSGDPVSYYRYDGEETARVRIVSDVEITNPNLFWASQMGLTNPAGIAYELTKFSWLIDWFVTLGEVINSWDDRLGLSFSNSCNVVHCEMTTTFSEMIWAFSDDRHHVRKGVVRHTTIQRDSGLGSGPFLLLRQIKGPSLVRGSTAIALLTQLLGRK